MTDESLHLNISSLLFFFLFFLLDNKCDVSIHLIFDIFYGFNRNQYHVPGFINWWRCDEIEGNIGWQKKKEYGKHIQHVKAHNRGWNITAMVNKSKMQTISKHNQSNMEYCVLYQYNIHQMVREFFSCYFILFVFSFCIFCASIYLKILLLKYRKTVLYHK